MPRRHLFVLALWAAFVCRGALHAVLAPMWDGYDEPGHLAYILFIDDHGRPPGYAEPSFPKFFIDANRYLPSVVHAGAPTFEEWRRMPPADRERSRATAAQLARNPSRYLIYASGNYERQQGPLFYYVAAIPGLFLRRLTLAQLLLTMRLFCVALASLSIPIGALFFRLVGGDRALAIGLPLFALAPNTLFAFDRVTNEVLAFPLMTAIAIELVIVTTRPRDRDFVILGLLTTAGLWTRITFLTVLPAIAVAVTLSKRRRRVPIALAVGLPLLATALLFAWNKSGTGHVTGFIEQSGMSALNVADVRNAVQYLRGIPLVPDFVRNHLWSGGWGFVKPSDRIYAIVVILLIAGATLAATSIVRRGWRAPSLRRTYALMVVVIAFAVAIFFHLISAAIGALRLPGSVTVGAAGWYFDEIRAMELGIIVLFLCAATRTREARRLGQLMIVVCATADLTGTIKLLLPRWGGYSGHPISVSVYRQALQAAPVVLPIVAPLAVAGLWITALLMSANTLQPLKVWRPKRHADERSVIQHTLFIP